MTAPPPLIFVIPLIAVGFDILCLLDLWQARDVDRLSKPQWAAAICLLTPVGGISYLMLGRRA